MWPLLVTGTISKIKVLQGDDTPIVLITFIDGTTLQSEQFVLWTIGDTNWIGRSLNLSLLRDALINKLQVNLTLPANSSGIILSVELLAA